MAEEVIGLLFGVEGVGVNGASGQEIVKGLTQIVNEINSGKSTVPKIKFHFDTTEATKAVDDLKKKLKDIEKIASIKVTYSNGGQGGKGGKGGAISQELQAEMKKFVALQKQISSMKMKIGKLEIDGGDVGVISAYTGELERLEGQYDKLMHTFMKKLAANPSELTMGDIGEWDAQLASLKRIEEATIAAARAKRESALADEQQAQVVEKQKQKYTELLELVSRWTKESKTGAKLSSEYSGVSRNADGTLEGTAPDYTETIAQINATAEAMRELRIEFDKDGQPIKPDENDFARIAAEIGISEEQYRQLFSEVQSGSILAGQAMENAGRKNQQSWTATASKIRDEVQRMYDTIAKDPNARKMADEIIRYSQSAEGSVGDLKNKYDELRNAIHESGADIETWGDKFKKTFAGKVRSALAGAITAAFTKYLREVYQNVVKIDEAMTDLQIASGKTREEVKELTKTYSALAQQLGSTTVEVAQAADTWLRQGYAAQEANTLIRNSTMLAKLGQMESAEASQALTSAMKGYGVSVENSIGIVDKFTSVDMEAAASAGDMATAMAETAASAKIAGVSMDTLIGYIAAVKEVTQDSSESVGTFFKTLLARMNNVAAGKFIDDETGEALNDVETVLNGVGIALRDTNGEFRSSSVVLDEVGRKWTTYNTVQQHAIATAMAGTRQQEKFIVLMENYGTAMNYANTAATSSGTAMEKYGVYTESLEGRLNALTASFEEFSTSLLDSDLVAFFIEILDGAVKALNAVTSFGDGFVTTLVLVSVATIAAFTLMGAAATKLKTAFDLLKTSFINALKSPLTYMTILTSVFLAFGNSTNDTVKWIARALGVLGVAFTVICLLIKTGVISTATTISTAIMNIPVIGWIIAIIQAVIVLVQVLVGAFDDWITTEAELRESALESAEAFQEQADAMKAVADAAEEAAQSVQQLIDEFNEFQDENGVADASEWMENIEAIGDEVAKLFPDEHLTSLQAINRLLDEELTYNQLINMTMEDRIGLLNDIESGTRVVSAQAARDAYIAQKNASDQLSYALTNYGYDLENDNETWTWGQLKGNQIKAAIAEAEEIASGIEGVSMSANAGKDIDIKIDGANISEYVDNLKAAVDEYEERYKYNFGALSENAVYKYLKDSLTQAEESLNAQQSALKAFVEQTAAVTGDGLSIEFDESLTKAEAKEYYDTTVNALLTNIKADTDIATAIADGLFGDNADEAIREYAEEYIRKYHTELFNAANDIPVIVPLKSAIDIFDELNGEYSLLKDAMDEFNETGMVSAKTIRSMTDEFPDLLKYIRQTEEGFTLIDGTLDSIMADYWGMKAKEYEDNITAAYEYYVSVKNAYNHEADNALEQFEIVKSAYEQLQNAIESGENFITAFNVENDALLEEQYIQMLEEQKDAIEEQADAFSDLCDIRKELLKTYKEEKDYADELAKKQQNVASLQKKLSVAQLDGSAAGQARVRELEAELKEAQDELDDFTLEHAIDVLTEQIESENAEYKALIENAVQRLENSINSAGSMTATALANAITQLGGTPVANGGNSGVTGGITGAIEGAQSGVTGDSGTKLPSNAPVQAPVVAPPKKEETPVKQPKKVLTAGTDYSIDGLGNNWFLTGKDDITVTLGGESFDVKVSKDKITSGAVYSGLNALYGGSYPGNGRLAMYGGSLYVSTKDAWSRIVEEDTVQLTNAYTWGLNNYHTGGFVGGINDLASNEEFAKLLKGEFVSTPAQMKRFMEETLPKIANYSATGGSNEFNAPLIEITCESVTTEALPELERIVNEAVKEIKRELDSGMSRTGFKRTPTKRLT